MRAALGASPARLARQSLVESLVLSMVAGAAGVAMAIVGVRILVELAPADLPRLAEVSLDGRALRVSLLASLLTGLLCGVGPAWRARRAIPNDALAQSGRSATDGPRAARVRRRSWRPRGGVEHGHSRASRRCS